MPLEVQGEKWEPLLMKGKKGGECGRKWRGNCLKGAGNEGNWADQSGGVGFAELVESSFSNIIPPLRVLQVSLSSQIDSSRGFYPGIKLVSALLPI